MTTRRSFLAILSLLSAVGLGAADAAAEELAYVEASSEQHGGKPASYVFNLVDGKPTTAWCSKGGPGPHTVVFGFKERQKITHFGVLPGAVTGRKAKLDETRGRVKRLVISDGTLRREIEFKHLPQMQEIKLDPPIESRRVVIDVVEARPGKKELGPVCIGEVLLKEGKKELTGRSIYRELRSLNTPSRRLLQSWLDEPSAPERTLLFALDGTFRYDYEPLLDGEPVRLRGKWRSTGRYLYLTVKGKKTRMRARLSKIDTGEGQRVELSLSGDGPHPSLNSSFRPAPIRFE